MKYHCLGLIEKKGEFDGRSYHLYELYCVIKYSGSWPSWGTYVEVLKVPAALFKSSIASPDDIVDEDILVYFNRYGKVGELSLAA
jgi:hypothetical protein